GNLLERGPRRPLSVGACLRFTRSPVWRHELDNVRVAIEYEEQLEATARADCHWNRVSPETVREDIVGDTLVDPEGAREPRLPKTPKKAALASWIGSALEQI